MTKIISALAMLALMFGATQTFAAVAAAAPAASTATAATATPQQSRMKSCAAQYHAKNIAKSQYHAFMSQCLKTHPASAPAKAAPAAPVAAGATP